MVFALCGTGDRLHQNMGWDIWGVGLKWTAHVLMTKSRDGLIDRKASVRLKDEKWLG